MKLHRTQDQPAPQEGIGRDPGISQVKSEQQKTAHIQKLAINKKSTIFVQSFWNLVKNINS